MGESCAACVARPSGAPHVGVTHCFISVFSSPHLASQSLSPGRPGRAHHCDWYSQLGQIRVDRRPAVQSVRDGGVVVCSVLDGEEGRLAQGAEGGHATQSSMSAFFTAPHTPYRCAFLLRRRATMLVNCWRNTSKNRFSNRRPMPTENIACRPTKFSRACPGCLSALF